MVGAQVDELVLQRLQLALEGGARDQLLTPADFQSRHGASNGRLTDF